MPRRKHEDKHPIALLREEAGFTQIQLGKKLGVAIRTVSDWESGKAVPSMENAIALAALFKISLKTLMGHFQLDTSDIPDDAPNP